MSMPEVALLLVAVLFGVYGCLSGLELGISLLRLTGRGTTTKLFTPLWEITNVFLVFGFTGFSVFFNNALPGLSKAVFGTLVVGMTALLLRACLVLYLYYGQKEQGWSLANLLFAVCSALVPLSYAAIGVYLLTGHSFWQTSTGWLLMVITATGLKALAVSFMQFVDKSANGNWYRLGSTSLVLLFAGLGTLGLQQIIAANSVHLASAWFVYWSALLDGLLLYAGLLLVTHKEQWLWWAMALVAIVAPIIWAWTNRPYLIYPDSLTTAYGAQAYDKAALIGFGLIFPVILLGLGLFVKLFTTQPRS